MASQYACLLLGSAATDVAAGGAFAVGGADPVAFGVEVGDVKDPVAAVGVAADPVTADSVAGDVEVGDVGDPVAADGVAADPVAAVGVAANPVAADGVDAVGLDWFAPDGVDGAVADGVDGAVADGVDGVAPLVPDDGILVAVDDDVDCEAPAVVPAIARTRPPVTRTDAAIVFAGFLTVRSGLRLRLVGASPATHGLFPSVPMSIL